MPQHRDTNFGATATSQAENDNNFALSTKGVFRGLDLGVSTSGTNRLTLAAGYGLQHDGVIWQEDLEVIVTFLPPGSAENYTVTARHDNRQILGGVAVDYDYEPGLLTNDTVLNGVVLGWIYHPGGGVPLAVEHLQSVPKNLPEELAHLTADTVPIELIPPYDRAVVTSVGLDLTYKEVDFDIGSFVIYQEVLSSLTAPTVQQVVQQFQFYVQNDFKPVSYNLYHNFANSPTAMIQVEVYDTNQTAVELNDGTFTVINIQGTGAWNEDTVTVNRTSGTFDNGKPYTLRLTFELDKTEVIQLSRVKANYWPFPQ